MQDVQKLYLMENSLGLHKIGISNKPDRRVREITNTSGIKCDIVAVWDINEGSARECEKHLHKEFSQYRQHGEWFKFEHEDVLGVIEASLLEVGTLTETLKPIYPSNLDDMNVDTLRMVACRYDVGEYRLLSDSRDAINLLQENKKLTPQQRTFYYYNHFSGFVVKVDISELTESPHCHQNIFLTKEDALNEGVRICSSEMMELDRRMTSLKSQLSPEDLPVTKRVNKSGFVELFIRAFNCTVYTKDVVSGCWLLKDDIVCYMSDVDTKEEEYKECKNDIIIFYDQQGNYLNALWDHEALYMESYEDEVALTDRDTGCRVLTIERVSNAHDNYKHGTLSIRNIANRS